MVEGSCPACGEAHSGDAEQVTDWCSRYARAASIHHCQSLRSWGVTDLRLSQVLDIRWTPCLLREARSLGRISGV